MPAKRKRFARHRFRGTRPFFGRNAFLRRRRDLPWWIQRGVRVVRHPIPSGRTGRLKSGVRADGLPAKPAPTASVGGAARLEEQSPSGRCVPPDASGASWEAWRSSESLAFRTGLLRDQRSLRPTFGSMQGVRFRRVEGLTGGPSGRAVLDAPSGEGLRTFIEVSEVYQDRLRIDARPFSGVLCERLGEACFAES